jgi:hypothetical protein
MNQPSSTITAAALAGMGMTLLFELLIQFDVLQPRATLVAASVTFVSALAGYLKKENVLPLNSLDR